MKMVFDFVIKYWELIAALLLWLVNFIVMCCKRKIKVVDTVYCLAVSALPSLIQQAEELFPAQGTGSSKFKWVLQVALEIIATNSDISVDEASKNYADRLTRVIEDILASPSKKGK